MLYMYIKHNSEFFHRMLNNFCAPLFDWKLHTTKLHEFQIWLTLNKLVFIPPVFLKIRGIHCFKVEPRLNLGWTIKLIHFLIDYYIMIMMNILNVEELTKTFVDFEVVRPVDPNWSNGISTRPWHGDFTSGTEVVGLPRVAYIRKSL